jgi:predicted dehydrogenase
MKSLHQIGAAVVGAGFIGPVHVEALRRLGVPVAGILGSTPARTRAAQESLGLSRAYASLEELLGDPAVEVVHLAVPNRLHHPMARQALLAGKHVLCEKPLAMDSSQSGELVALARERRLAAGVAFNVRFYPLNLEARQRIGEGEAGQVFSVSGSYVQDWLHRDTDYNWRVLAAEGGELRAVADIGTHWIDLVTFVTGLEVEAVLADLLTVHPTRLRPAGEVQTFSGKLEDRSLAARRVAVDTEDLGSVLFRFRGGARGSLHVSQVTAGRKNSIRYEIAGSKRSLAWESESPEELWIGRRDGPNQRLARDPSLLSGLARRFTALPAGHLEGYGDTFKELFRAFYQWVAAGDPGAPPLYPTFGDGHREILLSEAILRSHREEKWIKV